MELNSHTKTTAPFAVVLNSLYTQIIKMKILQGKKNAIHFYTSNQILPFAKEHQSKL